MPKNKVFFHTRHWMSYDDFESLVMVVGFGKAKIFRHFAKPWRKIIVKTQHLDSIVFWRKKCCEAWNTIYCNRFGTISNSRSVETETTTAWHMVNINQYESQTSRSIHSSSFAINSRTHSVSLFPSILAFSTRISNIPVETSRALYPLEPPLHFPFSSPTSAAYSASLAH